MTNFEIRYKLCHVQHPIGYTGMSLSNEGEEELYIKNTLYEFRDISEERFVEINVDLKNSGFYWKDMLVPTNEDLLDILKEVK